MTTNVALRPTLHRGPRAEPGGTTPWSWSIGKIAGIDIRVHGTFLILLAWIAIGRVALGQGLAGAAIGVATTLGMFAVVVLHEMSHALVARRFGIGTRNITLLPIGGVASLERMPDKPSQELLVALAGPLLNFALAAASMLVLVALETPLAPPVRLEAAASLLSSFFWFNLGLAVFNLLPAFPMDGGRVLRALLAMKQGRLRATETAARVGRWMALAFGVIGLLVSPMLVFIALFIWAGGREEAMQVELAMALERVPVAAAMATRFATIDANDSVNDAIALHLQTSQHAFPVLEGASFAGVVGTEALLQAHATRGGHVRVGDVMMTGVPVASASEPLQRALDRLVKCGAPMLPVADGGELVGLLYAESAFELARVRNTDARSAA